MKTLLLASISLSAFALSAAPTISLEKRAISVAGVQPNGRAVVFGVSRGSVRGAGISLQVTRSEVHDADGDGAIRLALDYDVPLRSVWVVVDLNTGEYAVAGPSEYAVVTRPLVPGALRRDRDGGVAFLDQNRSRLALLLVRPKRGAWFQLGDITRPASGGDGTADKLTLVFADGKAVGTHRDAAPRQLSARDVLVGIDPGRLDVFIYTAERD